MRHKDCCPLFKTVSQALSLSRRGLGDCGLRASIDIEARGPPQWFCRRCHQRGTVDEGNCYAKSAKIRHRIFWGDVLSIWEAECCSFQSQRIQQSLLDECAISCPRDSFDDFCRMSMVPVSVIERFTERPCSLKESTSMNNFILWYETLSFWLGPESIC